MHAQIITYQLKDISDADYQDRMVKPDAPLLAAVPGLHSKIWLSNPAANTFGGFYLWRDHAAMAAFMASDLVKAVVSRPYLMNVHSVDYAIPEEPSRITRGLFGGG